MLLGDGVNRKSCFWLRVENFNIRVRPFFKVFGAQPCAGRFQWPENEDIKFFQIGQRLPLPLCDLRKIYFTCYCNKNSIFSFIFISFNTCLPSDMMTSQQPQSCIKYTSQETILRNVSRASTAQRKPVMVKEVYSAL